MKEPNNGLEPIGEKTALAFGSAQAFADDHDLTNSTMNDNFQ
jgi:hypothetical protein